MWKAVLAGSTALAIAGSTLVYAQQPKRPAGPDGAAPIERVHRHWRPSAADFAALTDARVAALKAGLALTPDQEKQWPAVEQAIRDLAKARFDRAAERREARREPGARPDRAAADPIERLRRRADAMTGRAADLKKLADAAEPLYKTLDDGQKHRFMMLAQLGGGHGRFGHWHGGPHHRGPGGPGGPGQRGPGGPQGPDDGPRQPL